jgi:hypothetical protein
MRGVVAVVHTTDLSRQIGGHKGEQFTPELIWLFRVLAPLTSLAKQTLTRAQGAASPATERARRVTGGAERDILTWARDQNAGSVSR